MSDDSEKMFPKAKTVDLGDQKVEVVPIKVKMVPGILKAIKPFQGVFSGKMDNGTVFQVITEHFEEVATMLSIGIDKDRQWLDNLDLDQFAQLFFAFVEVNVDFFTQKFLPSVSRATAAFRKGVGLKDNLTQDGPMPSST